MFSCNYLARAVGPVSSWESDLISILNSASGGPFATAGTDTWIGYEAVIPDGAGPYLKIINTSGLETVETHNGDRYERPSAQLVTYTSDYLTGMNRALSIWRVLDGLRNYTTA